jgi:hypothetical protein
VLEAVNAYREAFKPSATLAEPYVLVSADVVVARDDETARRLASPYGLWVRGIRTGCGAIPFPTPEQATAHNWSASYSSRNAPRSRSSGTSTRVIPVRSCGSAPGRSRKPSSPAVRQSRIRSVPVGKTEGTWRRLPQLRDVTR